MCVVINTNLGHLSSRFLKKITTLKLKVFSGIQLIPQGNPAHLYNSVSVDSYLLKCREL